VRTLEQIKSILRQHNGILAEKYGVAIVGVFGSYVRGDQEPGSDLDVLAEVLRPISLLEFVGAEIYLSEKVGVKVDLIPRRDVREELRAAVHAETVTL